MATSSLGIGGSGTPKKE
jgi:hypothetical protein